MAKRTFDDWLGDLRELARDEMGCELDELEGYDEEQAHDAFRNGEKPKAYLREMRAAAESEEDVTELMREL